MHKLFSSALFVLAKYWKQPKCAYLGGWLNKLCHSCTMEYMQLWAKEQNQNPRAL